MAERLKDQFFTPASLEQMADVLQAAYPPFERAHFLKLVMEDRRWESLELKDRMHHVAHCLGATLPKDFPHAVEILKEAAPQINGFEGMALPDFIEIFGLEDWDTALPALGYLTRYASGEFAIRPFLDRDPERVLVYLHRWAEDENEWVRRLASEGSRPRLPWAMNLPRFQADPEPVLALLEKLKDDESETVRRSVANNLNDISKDHPERMLEVCEQWYGHSPRTDWIVKHACRSLLKAGHPRALRLFGFSPADRLTVENLEILPLAPAIGSDLQFSFLLVVGGEQPALVRLEYAVDFVKARGRTSRKVFLLSEKSYPPGRFSFQRKHSLVQRTTRTHYPGRHRITLLANGEPKAQAEFDLLPAAPEA